jgi:hypothetical protein
MVGSLRRLLDLAQDIEPVPLVFFNPPGVDFVNRDWVEVVQLFASPADGGHQVGAFEPLEVLRDGLPAHVEAFTELPERQPAVRVKAIEQPPPRRVGQRFEDLVDIHGPSICK